MIIPELEEVPGQKESKPRSSDWISIKCLAWAGGFRGDRASEVYKLCFQTHNHPAIKEHEFQPRSPLPQVDPEITDTSPSSQSDSTQTDVPDGLQCGICEELVTVKFRNCAHAVCAPCARRLWLTNVADDRLFPFWFPCHLCRAEIHEVGRLSRQPQDRGSGEEVRYGDINLAVWGWQSVRRWVRPSEVGVAHRFMLTEEDWGRYYMFHCNKGEYRVVPTDYLAGDFRAAKMDCVPGWPALIVDGFASVALDPAYHDHANQTPLALRSFVSRSE